MQPLRMCSVALQLELRSRVERRQVAGALTLSQIAKTLDIAPHWIYDRIHKGCIQISRDSQTNLYLFPDDPATLEQFRQLLAGTLKTLRFSKEHQDVWSKQLLMSPSKIHCGS